MFSLPFSGLGKRPTVETFFMRVEPLVPTKGKLCREVEVLGGTSIILKTKFGRGIKNKNQDSPKTFSAILVLGSWFQGGPGTS